MPTPGRSRPSLACRIPFVACCLIVVCAGWLLSAHGRGGQVKAPTPSAPAATPPPATAPFNLTHGPYLQLPTHTSIALVWHTNRPAVASVEYGTTDALGSTAVAAEHGLILNDRTSHLVRLTGLLPARTYKYRLVSREFVGYERQHIVKYGETVAAGRNRYHLIINAPDTLTRVYVSQQELVATITRDTGESLDTVVIGSGR
jgi:hypothetical protein